MHFDAWGIASLRLNGSVMTLQLGANKIGSAGAEAIAGAMKVNGSLTALDLRDNSIGDGAKQELQMRAFEASCRLQEGGWKRPDGSGGFKLAV